MGDEITIENEGYHYLLDRAKGDMRGMKRDLLRFLIEARDALDADPIFLACAKERIQTCLEIVTRE